MFLEPVYTSFYNLKIWNSIETQGNHENQCYKISKAMEI
jgi:hypothetical protein